MNGQIALKSRPPRARQGFTLVELMFVTALLGLLAVIAVQPLARARQSAMVAAAVSDMHNIMKSVELYRIMNNGAFPASVEDLQTFDFVQTAEVEYCRFELMDAGAPDAHVLITATHKRSGVLVTTRYPLWQGRIDQTDLVSGDC